MRNVHSKSAQFFRMARIAGSAGSPASLRIGRRLESPVAGQQLTCTAATPSDLRRVSRRGQTHHVGPRATIRTWMSRARRPRAQRSPSQFRGGRWTQISLRMTTGSGKQHPDPTSARDDRKWQRQSRPKASCDYRCGRVSAAARGKKRLRAPRPAHCQGTQIGWGGQNSRSTDALTWARPAYQTAPGYDDRWSGWTFGTNRRPKYATLRHGRGRRAI